MQSITIELTDTEYKCLQFAAVDPEDWVHNAAVSRSIDARDKIIAVLVAHCNDNEIALAVGRDAQINQAFELGVVDTAANLEALRIAEEAELNQE